VGRRLGELAGETEQANQLAKWLRGVTSGVTVKQLEDDFGYINKNRWTHFRNGSALIPEELLERVVEKYALPVEREIQVRRGKELLDAARRAQHVTAQVRARAPRTTRAPQPGSGETAAVDALLRLTASQEQLIEAERKLRDSEVREAYLQKVVSDLRRKQAQTEVERDRAREEARAALEREVKLLAEYRRMAGNQLERARRSHASALELRLAAEEKVVHDQAAVEDTFSTGDGPVDTKPVPTAEVAQLPTLDQIGEALHLADDDLAQHERELSDLRREIGQEFLTGSDHTKVVRGQLADSTDDARPASDDSSSPALGEPDGRHRPPAGEGSQRRWRLKAGLLAGATAVLLFPLPYYESGTARLDYFGGNLPYKLIKSSPTPSYSWAGISSQEMLTNSEGLQASFTPSSSTPVIPLERRLTARLVLSVPEEADTDCPDKYVGVSWAITTNADNREIASGSLAWKDGESVSIDQDISYEPETISLTAGRTVNTRDRCLYTLRLEKPAIHYRGWWEPT
jgi:hypothetical protein